MTQLGDAVQAKHFQILG